MPPLLRLLMTGLGSLIFFSLLCFSFLCRYSLEVLLNTMSQERQLRSLFLDFGLLIGSTHTFLFSPFVTTPAVPPALLFCPSEVITHSSVWLVCLWRCSPASVRKILEQNWHIFTVLLPNPGVSEESERVESPSDAGGESSGRLLASTISDGDGGSLQPAC